MSNLRTLVYKASDLSTAPRRLPLFFINHYLTTVGYISTVIVPIMDQSVPIPMFATIAKPFVMDAFCSVSEIISRNAIE